MAPAAFGRVIEGTAGYAEQPDHAGGTERFRPREPWAHVDGEAGHDTQEERHHVDRNHQPHRV